MPKILPSLPCLEQAMENPLVSAFVTEALMRGWVPKSCPGYVEIRRETRFYRMACPWWMFGPNVLIKATATWLIRKVRAE